MPGFQGPYQGQFAGVLAPPPPPAGFTPQQTMIAPMPVGMPPPMGISGMAMPPPPPGMQIMVPFLRQQVLVSFLLLVLHHNPNIS